VSAIDPTALGLSAAILLGAAIVGLMASWVLCVVIRRLDLAIEPEKTNFLLDTTSWRGPLSLLLPALAIAVAFPSLQLGADASTVARHLLSLWIISAVAYLLVRVVGVARQLLLGQFDIDQSDNLRARQAYTQVRVIERIAVFAIVVIAIASMLMTFDKVRQIGVSLLASAGIAGIVLGFAAQRSIATVIAGIQIALTQPIRLDDVVVVEGEWGRIEEITLTYVVVRIWDQRRLILPITYFIEHPFQNWTRTSAEILGTVFIYTDYSVPFEILREELGRLLEGSPLWDKRVCVLQVTNATEKTVEVRALMSAQDSSKAFELRCMVREQLISFVQRHYPDSLPRVRVELERTEAPEPRGSESGAKVEKPNTVR
jgi:small-conductance mechanosensitive channel